MKAKWLVMASVLSLFSVHVIRAEDGVWGSDSSGNWSVTNAWQGGTVADGAGSTASFTANISTTRTVTNGAPRTIGALAFSDNNGSGDRWILAGPSALTLSAGGFPEIRWLTLVSLNLTLAGTEPLLLKGSAGVVNTAADANSNTIMPPLAIAGANSFTGAVTIRRGRVAVYNNIYTNAAGPLGNGVSAIQLGDAGTASSESAFLQFVLNGGTFERDIVVGNYGKFMGIGDGASGTGESINWNGNLQLERDIWIFGRGAVRVKGRISGPGGIIKNDINTSVGTLTLLSSNDFSGPVTVSCGTLYAAHPNALGTGSSPIQLGDSSNTAAVALTLTNGITLERDVDVTEYPASAAIGMAGVDYVCGVSGRIRLWRNLSPLSSNKGKFFLSGYMTGTGGVYYTGGNTASQVLLVGATNDFSGPVTITKGVMVISNQVLKSQPGPLGQSASAIRLTGNSGDAPTLTVNANGRFERDVVVTNTSTAASITTAYATNLVFTGALTNNNPWMIISAVNATNQLEWAGPVSGWGVIQKDGAGTLVLSGTNTGWSGGIYLVSGAIKAASPEAFGSIGRVYFYTGGGENLQNVSDATVIAPARVISRRKGILSGPGDVIFTGGITNASDANSSMLLQVDQAGARLGIRGYVMFDLVKALTKSGAGILEWGCTNLGTVFTNTIEVQAGVFRAIPDPSIVATNPIYLNGGVLESQGALSRDLGIGSGKLQFRNAASYPGGFSAYGGSLTVDLNGEGADTLTWAAGYFVTDAFLFGSVRSDSEAILVDGIELGSAARTIRVTDNPDSLADKGVIRGAILSTLASGQLYIQGDGVLSLAGTNTFVAPSFVTNATLLVDGELAAAPAGTLTMRANSRLGGRGLINRPLALQPGFGGFDWADTPGTLTIRTNVTLPAGFTYHFRRTNGVAPRVDVTGTLTASNGVTVNVYGETQPVLTLFTAGTLAGTQNLTNWTVTGSSRPYAVKVQGTSIVAAYPSSGMLLIVR